EGDPGQVAPRPHLARQPHLRGRPDAGEHTALLRALWRQKFEPPDHADATGRTAPAPTTHRGVWDLAMSAGFEHGCAHWHHSLTAIWIGDTNHLALSCRQSPHRAGNQYESDTGRQSSQDGVVDALQE